MMKGFVLVFKTFWSPGSAFEEIAESPVRPWAAILVLTIVGLISAGVITATVDPAEMALRAMEQSPQGANLTEEQKEQFVERLNNPAVRYIGFAGALVGPTVGFAGALVGPTVLIVVLSGIYFGIFMILGSSAKYGKFFSLTSFAMLPLLIRNVAATMMVLFIPSSAINPQELGGIAPSAFLDPTEVSRTVFAIAQSLDLITFWVLILLIIAYRNVAPNRTSVITRTIGVLIPWLILVAGRVGLTLLF